MVYTITLNPAIDYVVHSDKLIMGEINSSSFAQTYVGGKGINVSIVLNELGVKSKALGFVAGFTGNEIVNGISAKGVETDFVILKKGFSRINVKIKSDVETELNGEGPEIDDTARSMFFSKLDNLMDGDTIVLAGSVPKSLPSDIYEKILERISHKNIKAVVDARKDLLLKVLKYSPFLIKPNNHELCEIFGEKTADYNQLVTMGKKLQTMGARNVLISMAGDGAILLDENNNIHSCGVCRGNVVNSVGAGDSMVAGFIAGCENGDFEYALKLGTAAGGATAFSDGLAEKERIFTLLKTL